MLVILMGIKDKEMFVRFVDAASQFNKLNVMELIRSCDFPSSLGILSHQTTKAKGIALRWPVVTMEWHTPGISFREAAQLYFQGERNI